MSLTFGNAGGIVLTVALLPQIAKTWRTQRSDDVSLAFVALLTMGRGLWLAHGLSIGDAALVMGAALAALVLHLRLQLPHGAWLSHVRHMVRGNKE